MCVCVCVCVYSAFRKYSDPLHFFQFCYVAAWYYNCLIFFFSLIYNPYLIMTKWKQNFRNVCKFLKKKDNLKYHIYISIQTLCKNTWNLAQVPPISLDHCWDVSTPCLESTCGKVNWLDMIWKGTHLSIKERCDNAYQSETMHINMTMHIRAKTTPWRQRNCLQSSETGLYRGTYLGKATKTILLNWRFPRFSSVKTHENTLRICKTEPKGPSGSKKQYYLVWWTSILSILFEGNQLCSSPAEYQPKSKVCW